MMCSLPSNESEVDTPNFAIAATIGPSLVGPFPVRWHTPWVSLCRGLKA